MLRSGGKGICVVRLENRYAPYFVNPSCLAMILRESCDLGLEMGLVARAIIRPLPSKTSVFLATHVQIGIQGLEWAIFSHSITPFPETGGVRRSITIECGDDRALLFSAVTCL